jgi:hypothetical protein
MLTPSEYQNIICNIEQIIICGNNNYRELLQGNNNLSDYTYSTIRKNAFSLALTTSASSLFLVTSSLNELNIFISKLQKHITDNYGNYSNFVITNSINIPENFANKLIEMGYSIPSDYINNCNYSFGISSSSSSVLYVDSVVKLSSTDYMWNFNKNIIGNSINLENIVGLVLGDSKTPSSIIDYLDNYIILKYISNSETTWQIKLPVDIIFDDGSLIGTVENGTLTA